MIQAKDRQIDVQKFLGQASAADALWWKDRQLHMGVYFKSRVKLENLFGKCQMWGQRIRWQFESNA